MKRIIFVMFILLGFICITLVEAQIQLTADVNRDRILDPTTDDLNEDVWSFERGAVFLNNDDSDANNHTPDNSDSIINTESDIEDFAELQIQQKADISDSAALTLAVNSDAKDKVNIFIKTNDNLYNLINLSQTGNINSTLLKNQNMQLFIEGKTYSSPTWNGFADITVTLQDGTSISSDTVRMKCAPFMLLSGEQKCNVVYVREIKNSGSYIYTENFVKDIMPIVIGAGATLHIVPDDSIAPYYPYYQIWMQDTMEIGYSEIPGKKMNVILKGNRNRALDNYAKDYLLSPDYGWFTCGTYRADYASGDGGNSWLDWYGNLEATPPLSGYPFGRIIYGYNPGAANPNIACMNPDIINMLNAQGIQSPALRIDAGWLTIKHVDEIINFLSTGNPQKPYKVLVHDVNEMISLVQSWKDQGYGNSAFLTPYKTITVNSFLNNTTLKNYNINLQATRIEPIINLLKTEFNLGESDFIRIPSYFENGDAYFPNMVNSLSINGSFIIAKPYGLVINGKDQVEEYVKAKLASLPVNVYFVDNYRYHIWSGEVHCATNAKREGFEDFWHIDTPIVGSTIWSLY